MSKVGSGPKQISVSLQDIARLDKSSKLSVAAARLDLASEKPNGRLTQDKFDQLPASLQNEALSIAATADQERTKANTATIMALASVSLSLGIFAGMVLYGPGVIVGSLLVASVGRMVSDPGTPGVWQ